MLNFKAETQGARIVLTIQDSDGSDTLLNLSEEEATKLFFELKGALDDLFDRMVIDD